MTDHELGLIKDAMPLSQLVGREVALRRERAGEFTGLCPFHDEKTPSFRVNDQRGRYHCYGCGADGDHFDFLIAIEGLAGLPEAKARLRDLAGLPEDAGLDVSAEVRARREKEAAQRDGEEQDRRGKIQRAAAGLWNKAREVSPANAAGRYLAGRGLAVTGPGAAMGLRFDPDCYNGKEKRGFPALLAPVRWGNGELAAVWRIFLDPEDPGGQGAARARKGRIAGEHSKLGLGPVLDPDGQPGCVRLLWPGDGVVAPDCHTLVIGEGVESSAAAVFLRQRLGAPAVAVASLLSSDNLRNFVPPDWVRTLIFLGEEDTASRRALYGPEDKDGQENRAWLQKTCAGRGIELRALWPADWGVTDKGSDMLDVWQRLDATLSGRLAPGAFAPLAIGHPDGVSVATEPAELAENGPETGEDAGDVPEAAEDSRPEPDADNKPKKNRLGVLLDQMLGETPLLTDDSGTVYRYGDGYWHPLSETGLKNHCYRAANWLTISGREDLRKLIRERTYRAVAEWGQVGLSEIACKNGILDVVTGQMRAHSPENLLERIVPWTYRPDAECPNWLQALVDWFGESGEGGEIAALQEYFGYICLSHARFKRALMLIGPSNSGKSQVAHAARKLVGDNQTCALSPGRMGDPGECAVIVGKALNVVPELGDREVLDDAGLKMLVSTGEPISINIKYKDRFMYIPTAKHLFCTNKMPHSPDKTEAVAKRLLFIPFRRTFADSEQKRDLPDLLETEMDGIFAWAVAGAKRLCARGGKWPEVPAAAPLLADFLGDSNPMAAFLEQECEQFAADGRTVAVPLVRLAERYTKLNKGGKPVTGRAIGGMLRALNDPRVVIKQARQPDGRNLRSLLGWRLKPEAEIPDHIEAEETALYDEEMSFTSLGSRYGCSGSVAGEPGL